MARATSTSHWPAPIACEPMEGAEQIVTWFGLREICEEGERMSALDHLTAPAQRVW